MADFSVEELFTPEEIAARKAEKIGSLIGDAERAVQSSGDVVTQKQSELETAQAAHTENQNKLNGLYAERDGNAQG